VISETVMTITFACVGDGSRTEALMRAHETHIEMLAVTNGCVLKAVPYVRRWSHPAETGG